MYMPITMTRDVSGDTYLRMCLNGLNNCACIFCFEGVYFSTWSIGGEEVESNSHTDRGHAIDYCAERMISLYQDATRSVK